MLDLKTIEENLKALDGNLDDKSNSGEYFQQLQEDNQEQLIDFIEGKLDLALDTYASPEAFETTKAYIEAFVGGYNTTRFKDEKNAPLLKEVYEKALAKLNALHTQALENKKEAELNSVINSDEQLFNRFMETADKARYITNEDEKRNYINSFIEEKNAYLATKNAEETKNIEDKLNNYLNNNPDNEIFWGNDLFLIDEDFKKTYEDIDHRENKEEKVIEEEEKNTDERNEFYTIVQEEIWRAHVHNSDENEPIMDNIHNIQLSVLRDIGVINDKLYNEGIKNPVKALETLENRISLTDTQASQYEEELMNKVLESEVTLLPSFMAERYNGLKKAINNDLEKDENADVSNKQRQLELLANKIDRTLDDYYTGINSLTLNKLNFDDRTNIADIYDGYKEMVAARMPDVNEKEQEKLTSIDNKLDRDIKEYDEAWNIPDSNTHSAEELNKELADNLENLNKQITNLKPSEETLSWLKNVNLLDENGNIENQFDEDGNIIEGSKLEAIIDFAKQNTLLSELNNGKDIDNEALQNEFEDRIKLSLLTVANAEQLVKTGLEEPDKFTNHKYRDKLIADLANPDKKITISDAGYKKAVQTEVNNTMAYINRLSKSVGENSEILKKIHKPIEKYDEQRDTRFVNKNANKESFWKTFGWTAASTIASKTVAWGIHATTGASMGLSAGIMATGLSLGGMAINYNRYKKNAKKNNKKASLKEFLTKEPYRNQNIASALGFAAGACLLTGHPVAASALGATAVGILGYNTYKKARKNGMSKKEAWKETGKKLGGVIAGIATGSLVNSMFGNISQDISQDVEYKEVKVTEPTNVTHDYTREEINWAEGRLSDPRWSEFLNKFIVADQFQDASNPNNVSSHSVENLVGAVGQSTDGISTFSSSIDGQLVSNADMLSYKMMQLAYLAPNPDAITTTGEPIGDILGYTDPNTGDKVTYLDLINQAVNNGKFDNPELANEVLAKVENVIGGQIGDGVNDMGKITLFGTGPEVSPVQSYNANADSGYDITQHYETKTHIEVIPGEVNHVESTLHSVGYWEPIKNVFSKLKKRAGAFADALIGKKKYTQIPKPQPEPTPVPPQPEPTPVPPQPEPTPVPPQPEPTPVPPQPEPTPVPPQPEEKKDRLLMDEYKIVHGCEPNNSEYNRYKGLVEKEFEQDKSSNGTKASNFHDYLYERQKNMEDKIFSPENVDAAAEVSLTKDREGLLSERSANMENADIVKEKGVRLNAINNTRNTILQGHKNLDAVKYKPIKNLTLKDFMKVMTNVFKKNNQGNSNTIDPSKAPIRSKRER